MRTVIPFRWDGEAMRIAGGFRKQADTSFVVGAVYHMEVVEDRSAKSHRHFFSAIAEAHASLPEAGADRFPTPDHLRKYALIRSGFASESQIVASSRAEALRIAAFIRPIDGYAVVTVREAVVSVWTAESQSMRAMGKERFQASKNAVLEFVSSLIGATPDEIMRSAA